MNLWSLLENSQTLITALSDEIPAAYRQRLNELGFHPNEKITCVRVTPAGNPRLYRVGDSVYSLEKEIAVAIEVGDI
ncbi:ferrous iron transport protein A [bacterium]|nr:ferrous iron transport protein A [bacterium]